MAVRRRQRRGPGGGRALLGAVLWCVWWRAAAERVRYAIPEELGRGSLVGPLARDLGLSADELPARRLQVASAGKKQMNYFTVNEENGNLYVNERLDREEMCGESATCSVSFEVLVHNPLNVFHVEVAIEDVNDNSPSFSNAALDLDIGEWTPPGARFPLEMAQDADVGSNSLLTYQLTSNPSFSLAIKESPDGSNQPELVLERALDREKQSSFELVLTALDAGDPVRSGTIKIRVNVTDANDNPPVFGEDRYRVRLREDSAPGSRVLNVSASDADTGNNAHITYGFGKMPAKVLQKFMMDAESGMITLKEALDFEDTRSYTLLVEARDGGGLMAQCKVVVEVLDVNDNAPEITILSLSSPVPEDAPFYLVLALALLSALLVLSVALLVLARLRRAGPPAVLRCLGAQRFSVAGAAFPADFCEGTLPYSYNLCVAAPARAVPEAAWPPPPPAVPILSAEELLGGDSCEKPSPNSSAVVGEPPAASDSAQVQNSNDRPSSAGFGDPCEHCDC
ncbi:hypothetical protein HGM15179_012625 [Zosterops borbonicus]|uniref:Cadherin domain-containing protein n=1 Tax=Zosterops borbonicus TaxID=364589 RepID=A0A8K1LHX6_9PASS|nr:hypothetical protein HGM15179_012625 [Zosterops borbonicus]